MRKEKDHPLEYQASKANQKKANRGEMKYNTTKYQKMIMQEPKSKKKKAWK